MNTEENNESATGWDAIDDALAQLYGPLEPKHYGTTVKYMMGGPDPLDGISAYPVDEPGPHWHFVTYGLTELYDKESSRADVSGFGFELTLRLAREQSEMDPPAFALNFLQNLARYVFDSGQGFSPGHTMDLNGPIALGRATEIAAVCFVADPDLPVIETPHGRVEFIQIVGVTRDELMAAKAWQKSSFLEVLSRRFPKLVTDLGRVSILEDESIANEIRQRTAKEGSSTGAIFASRMTVNRSGVIRRRFRWTLGALEASTIGLVLPGRVPFGQPLTIKGPNQVVLLLPGKSNGVAMEGGELKLTLNADGVQVLAAILQPRRGEYHLEELPTLVVVVVPSEIRDREGNVVGIIG